MADFATTLTVLGHALNVVKGLNQIDREFDKAELKMKVAELSGALATAQITLAEAQREAADKDAELGRLKASFREKQDLVERHGYYYRKRSDGTPQGPPYCSRCIQKGALHMTTSSAGAGRPQKCPDCKAAYQGVSVFLFEGE